jgi:hypothetical protein
MKELWCWGCQAHKKDTEFYRNRTSSTGHEQLCKICKTARYAARRAQRKAEGVCHCGRELTDGFETCATCRKRVTAWARSNPADAKASSDNYRRSVRQRTFNHYGWTCACCGEANSGFLTIDHIHGGGNKHRKEIGGGNVFYAWLIRQGYPEGYQTLCYNCNCGRAHNGGICPHEHGRLTTVAPLIDVSTDLLPSAPEVPITAPGLVN